MTLRTSLALAVMLALCSCSTAWAAQVYVVEGPTPAGLADVNLRDLPGLSLLVTADERSPIVGEGIERLSVPRGMDAYLVRVGADIEFDALRTHSTVLHRAGDFVVVTATARQQRALDLLRMQRERLTYVRPQSTQPVAFTQSKVEAQVKADIVAAVDQSRYTTIVRELSGDLFFWLDGILRSNNNRYTFSAKHYIAADYLEERFEALGYTVVRQNFTVSGTPTQNILAIKTGTVAPDEIVVAGGHYDSTSDNTAVAAPGAEDNASGTAGVLHLAEVFAEYETERTIHFIAFGGEEQGLFGSQHYVNQAISNGDNVIGAITMDMISAWQSNYKVIIEGETPWQWLMTIFKDNVISEAQIGYRQDYFSFGSDHVPFQNAGIPAFLAIDMDYGAYPGYHKTTDTVALMDFSLGWRILLAGAGALADLTNPSDPATATPPLAIAGLELGQNRPNPFNPSTQIPYSLPQEGPVRLDVFDAQGRFIRNLVSAVRPAGDASVTWDGSDETGQRVSSGLYMVRLQSTWGERSQRMMLLK